MSTALQPPPEEHLDEARLTRLLTELEFPESVLSSDWIDDLFAVLDDVIEHDDGVRRWWTVGDAVVKPLSFSNRRSAYSFGCDCARRGLCPHVGSVLLALAWIDPEWRPRFVRPLWEWDLAPLLDASASGPERVPHRGHLRYHLVPGDGELKPLRIEVEVIRRSKRSGSELKPIAAPRDLDKLQGLVSPVHPWDEELHAASIHMAELDRAAEKAWSGGGRLLDIGSHVGRLALRPLERASDVRHRGQPVRVSLRAIRPRIVASRVSSGLELHWVPEVIDAWSGGLVLTADGVLHPLASDAREEDLTTALPHVPRLEERRFVDEVVVGRGLPVDLPPDVAGVRDPEERVVQVLVEEEQFGVLLVRPVARYVARGEPVVVPLAEGAAVHADPTSGLVRRDLDWERAECRRIQPMLGSSDEQRLVDDEALDFLTDTVPRLAESVEVFGERSVLERAVGQLEPEVVVTSGVDWFQLDVGFSVGDVEVDAAKVLNSWLHRARYHRLDDGRVVRLPDTWLRRHGEAAMQVVELQDDDARLGPHTALSVRDLIAEAGQAAREWLEVADGLADFDGLAAAVEPEGFRAELRDYQRKGLAWLTFLRDRGLGGVLADDMGLGKTIQVLALLADSHRDAGEPSLVVAPRSVLRNWQREAARFAPGLRVHVHHGPNRGPIPDDADIVLTTYALLRLDLETLGGMRWRHAVLDEAQAIKNPASQVAAAARKLRAAHPLALSGTPLENRIAELWSLFSFVMPGFFGSYKGFSRRYVVPIERERSTGALSELRARIRPFVLRRLKHEVASELPPRTVSVLATALSRDERRLYDRVKHTYRESVVDAAGGTGARTQPLHVLEALTRLRQAACHPALLPFDEARVVRHSSKVALLVDRLTEAASEGHQSLVFSQWPSLLKLARRDIEAAGLECLLLDGATRNRQELVDRFSAPGGPPVFLISIKAGGTGLNLTTADHVFHLDPWWNPAVEDQATDRAHRIGQTRPVMVYRLIAEETVEELVLDLQERKRGLARAAIDEERLVIEELTREELLAVFDDNSEA